MKNRKKKIWHNLILLFPIIFLAAVLFSLLYVQPKAADATKRLPVSPPTAEERAQAE